MLEDTAFTLVGSIGVGTLALLGAASLASLLSSARREQVRRRTDRYRPAPRR